MNGTMKALALIGAPAVLLQLVCLIYKCNTTMCMNIDMCEYFAGCMAVSGTHWERCSLNFLRHSEVPTSPNMF